MSYPASIDSIGTVSSGGTITSAYQNSIRNAVIAIENAAGTNPARSLCEGRLSLTTGVPVTTADVTGATHVYFTPWLGNRIGLYDGTSAWNVYAMASDVDFALGTLIANANYDLFCYDNSGTLTLEAQLWKNVAATNNPAAGSSVVINVADTSGVAVNDPVTIDDGISNEVQFVTALVTNTSITVGTLSNSYTTPTIYYNSRGTNIALQDGIYVKSGATTRRYLGTFRTTSTTATEDSAANRLLWNMYHRVSRKLRVIDGATSWTYSTAAFRQAHANAANAVQILIGLAGPEIHLEANATRSNTSATVAATGIGVNSTTSAASGVTMVANANAASSNAASSARYDGSPSLGYSQYAWLESGSGSGTDTWYGTSGNITSGMSGFIQ